MRYQLQVIGTAALTESRLPKNIGNYAGGILHCDRAKRAGVGRHLLFDLFMLGNDGKLAG